MSPEPLLLTLLLGSLVGFVLGLTGAGGGILAVPLLVFGLNLPMQAAAPVGLTAVGLAAAIGAAIGLREGVVRYRAAALIGAFGVMMAPLGVWLAQHLPNQPLLLGFAGLLVLTGGRMFRHARRTPEEEAAACRGQPCKIDPNIGRLLWTLPCARALALTGMLSGLFSGLLGVGGGFVIVPALSRYTDLLPRSVLATSMGVIALVALGGVGAAAIQGTVIWALALPFAGGAVGGVLLGRYFSAQLAGARLQQAFALVCFGVAILFLLRGLGLSPV